MNKAARFDIMGCIHQLSDFYQAIATDPRINTSHISLYMALFQHWNLNHFENPISIVRSQVMEVAKISGVATYHKCMKDLHNYGYIEYIPSYNPPGSRVYMRDCQTISSPRQSKKIVNFV